MKKSPPKLAEKILSRLQYDDVWKTTLGDFEERYAYMLEREGESKANRWYWGQVFRYAPSKIIHKLYWSIEMFRNYLKVAYRNIRTDKGYSFINISGLGIGLASFFLIGIYIVHELSYDAFHEDSDRIYLITRELPKGESSGTGLFGLTPMVLSITLADNFSGVEHSTAFNNNEALFRTENNSSYESGIHTDVDFFDVFSIEWILGGPGSSFNDPNAIILTQSLANKYFKNENPVGKSIFIDSDNDRPKERIVTGLIADFPPNSQIKLDFIIPSFSIHHYQGESTSWVNANSFSYVKISPNTTSDDLSFALTELVHPKLAGIPYYQDNPDQLPGFKLIPAEDVHFSLPEIKFTPSPQGDIKYIYMLSAIALIILIIACVNYMNLATARSMTRAKEIGVRKVTGALRSNIMMQFTSEALLFSMIGIILSILIFALVLPNFSELVDRSFDLSILFSVEFFITLLLIGLLVGLFVGSYPAFFMSALPPIGIFNDHMKGGNRRKKLRNGLVIGQFAITNVLIVGSIVVFQQLQFIKTSDLGFNQEQVLAVTINDRDLMDNYDALKSIFDAQPDIISVSSSRTLPTKIRNNTTGVSWDGKQEDEVLSTYNERVNIDYIELLGIDVIAGRAFNNEMDTDSSNHFVINKTMANKIGWTPEEAIEQPFEFWGRGGKIVGVIDDFNFLSYHYDMAPLILRYSNNNGRGVLLFKISSNNISQTISFIEEQISSFSPAYPFEYSFLDDTFNTLYKNEITTGKTFNYFTLLALIIACMGLFGLASFIIEQRTKEIGIRKVLGANIPQIFVLLNRDFLKLVGISLAISIPFGWFFANNWLQDFAFRINLSPMIFILAALIATGIALLTVSFKSFKTALANPVDSLKSE